MDVTRGAVSTSAGAPSLARLLRELRERALLTQEELAARTGLSVGTVRGLESGRNRRPRCATVRLLAEALAPTGSERQAIVAASRGRPPLPATAEPTTTEPTTADTGAPAPDRVRRPAGPGDPTGPMAGSRPAVEFRVLGSLAVHRDGTPITPGGLALRRLLAGLLCRSGHAVPALELVGAVWPDGSPDRALSTLHVYVHRLRRALDDDGRIVHEPAGYRITAGPDELDSRRFGELARRGETERRGGDLHRASSLFTEALNLWRGAPYADVAGGALISWEARRLAEQWLLARERRIEINLDLGRPAQLVTELTELVHAHPYRERLTALLMLALYRGGRQAEALEVYARTRARLRRRLGVRPGTLLRRLHGAIRGTDYRLVDVAIDSLDGDWVPAPHPAVSGRTAAQTRAFDG